jgi:hypothetical protein
MGALQLVTMVALDQGRGTQRQMGAPFTLTRLRDLTLGDAHAALLLDWVEDAAV